MSGQSNSSGSGIPIEEKMTLAALGAVMVYAGLTYLAVRLVVPKKLLPRVGEIARFEAILHRGHLAGLSGGYSASDLFMVLVAELAVIATILGVAFAWWILHGSNSEKREREKENLCDAVSGKQIAAQASLPVVQKIARETRPSLGDTRPSKIPVEDAGFAIGRHCRSKTVAYRSFEDSYAVFGQPRQGKSSSVVLPWLFNFPGPAVVTSTKPEIMLTSFAVRKRESRPVYFFGSTTQPLPKGIIPMHYDLLAGCEDPEFALRRGLALAAGAKVGEGENGAFWQDATAQVLALRLFAAARIGADLRAMLFYTKKNATKLKEALNRNVPHAKPVPEMMFSAFTEYFEEQTEASRTVHTIAASALKCFSSDAMVDACSAEPQNPFSPKKFIKDRATLYISGSSDSQNQIASIVAALLDDLVVEAKAIAASSPGGRLDPTLGLFLDEVANIAPLPSLPSLLSEGGGQGITTVAVFQTPRQAEKRWGRVGADEIYENATVKLVLAGLSDPSDLNRFASTTGERTRLARSYSTSDSGSSESRSEQLVQQVRPDQFKNQEKNEAYVILPTISAFHARLFPWYATPDLVRLRNEALITAAGMELPTPVEGFRGEKRTDKILATAAEAAESALSKPACVPDWVPSVAHAARALDLCGGHRTSAQVRGGAAEDPDRSREAVEE